MEKDIMHGTPSRYQHEMKSDGYACPECTRANRDYARSWRIRAGHTTRIKVSTELLRGLTLAETVEDRTRLLQESVGALTGGSILSQPEPEPT